MLKSFLFTFKFHRFCQSGLYLDFFIKKLSEIFVRNVFIYGALFFGEKYMIELLTKKIFNIFVLTFNKKFSFFKLSYSMFFINVLSILFYSVSLLLIIIL
jgi:hypothetical protein